MAIAWFVCEYKIGLRPNQRYCAMDDFTPQIIGQDGGTWSESEILGGYAVVKVRASDATLATIAGTAGYYRIPNHFILNDILSDLTNTQRNAITNRILAMGYTQAEIDAVMGNTLALWRQKTLVILLAFMAQRRLKPRWDDVQQQIVLDGILQACKPVTLVDTEV